MKNLRPAILPLLILSVFALLVGMWAGLARIGWSVPTGSAAFPLQHGSLMISGFLGTLIALERVAALQKRWMFAAPLFSGSGWLLGLVMPGESIGPLLIVIGSLFAVGIQIVIVRREPKIYTFAIATGVLCWFLGNLFWAFGTPIFQIIWVWAAFLILTIAGERLELSRILRFKPWQYWLFTLAAGVFLVGAFLFIQQPAAGVRIAGGGMIVFAVWLLLFDIARRNLRHPSALTRFISTCLYGGFIWLGLSGLLNLIYGPQFAGPWYDAQLHCVFVGFVFSMIFGHALIILPALLQIQVPFHKAFYFPLVLLHGSLALRITGDLTSTMTVRMWGGLLNEIAILGFIGILIGAVFYQRAFRFEANKKAVF